VCFEDTLPGNFAGKVFACVEEFEEAADGIVIFVWELDLSRLLSWLISKGRTPKISIK
jgi:hypothetical protein